MSSSNDGRVKAVIDFEKALWGEPLMEFYVGRMGRSRALEQGYGAQVATAEQRHWRALYDLYLDLVLAIECTSRFELHLGCMYGKTLDGGDIEYRSGTSIRPAVGRSSC